MLTEKDTIKCEAVFNEARTHRFLWKRVWNKDKPLAAVLMLNPSMSDNLVLDTTSTLVVNNIARLEKYGGVEVVNLYSLLTNKLEFRWNSDEDLNEADNDRYIQQTVLECDTVILAWGKASDTNQRIGDRVEQVLKLLEKSKEKLCVISDGERTGLHPLTPSIRGSWQLVPFTWPVKEAKEEKKAGSNEEKKA